MTMFLTSILKFYLKIMKWTLLIVWRFSSNIWRRAYKLSADYLAPRDRDVFTFSKAFTRIGLMGLGILVVVQMRFEWPARGFRVDPYIILGDALTGTFMTTLYVGAAVVVGAVIMFAASHRGYHRENARYLSEPLKKLAVCLAILLGGVGLAWGSAELTENGPGWGQSPNVEIMLNSAAACIGFPLFIMFFAFVAALLRSAPRDLFAARDGHPHLRPLVSLLLATWTGWLAAKRLVQEGVDPSYPLAIFVIVVVIGPVGNIAASVIEIRWLQQRAGVSFRFPKGHSPG